MSEERFMRAVLMFEGQPDIDPPTLENGFNQVGIFPHKAAPVRILDCLDCATNEWKRCVEAVYTEGVNA